MPTFARASRRILKWLALGAVAGGAIAVALTAGLYLYLQPGLPRVERLEDVRLQEPLRVYAANGGLMGVYGEKRRYPVELADVPPRFRNAFIAAEDDRFHEHPGVDWMGIARAAWNLVLTGEKSQGGSTITMQVARNFFLSREKTYIRKIREIFLAFRIHAELSKDEVLELYLNKIYLGAGAYGIAAAAQTYYGEDIDELTLAQMATIAGLPRAPALYNPAEHPRRARVRRNYVLRRMHDNGMIDRRTLQRTLSEPVLARVHEPPIEVAAPYVAEMARRRAVARLGEAAYTDGYRVYTTLVAAEQREAVEAVRAGLQAYAARHGYAGPIDHVDPARLPSARECPSRPKPASSGAAGARRSTPRQAQSRTMLAAHAAVADLRPAVALRVEADGVTVRRRSGRCARIHWSDMRWVAPRRADGTTGSPPDGPADVLARGDVVYIEPGDDGRRVDLAQVPRAQAALVALDPRDGAIRALVGGHDFTRSRFNRATQAQRQPGSTFKPFIYSAALDRGFTPATLINDAPVVFDAATPGRAWRPENYSGRVFGPTRLREALVHSRNLVSIRVLRRIGIPYTIDYVQRFGFSPEQLPGNLTLALGSASVTPMQLARAYAVFANMGHRVEPHLVTRIADAGGSVVYRAEPAIACDAPCGAAGGSQRAARAGNRSGGVPAAPAGRVRRAPRAIPERNAYLVRSFLRDVARRGTAQGTRVLGRDDIGAKTGTTDDQRDAWFAGFNSSVVAVTWVGFDRMRPLGRHETGARAAMPIWLDFMRAALAGTPRRWPARPPGMVSVRIDPDTGDFARPGDEGSVFEIFRAGNAPEPGGGGREPAVRHLF